MTLEDPRSKIQDPEKPQDPSPTLRSGYSGRELDLGSWSLSGSWILDLASLLPFSACWMLVLGCLLLPLLCFAQRQAEPRPAPLDPVQAEREARALVADMLSQKPVQTNTGTLRIRNAKGEQRDIPMRFEIWSTADTSTSIYEAKDPGPPACNLKLTVIHSDGRPNQYSLSEGNGPAKALSGDETMVPFAGSDFWIADLGLEFLHWPQQRLQKKEMRRSRFCDVLESVNPKPGGRYSKVVSWVERESPHGIVHADAYDSHDAIVKKFDPTEVEKVQGEYQLQEMEIRDRKTGSRTWIAFNLGAEKR